MRKIKFAIGEFYHIYNRGVDKRNIITKENNLLRFLKSINEFNSLYPMGGIYKNSFILKKEFSQKEKDQKLVDFIAFCINQNHYHFILSPLVENGIEKFMHRLSTGYTKYFNEENRRTGSLFQGRYKANYVDTNEYLLYLSAYVNLNNKVHNNLNENYFDQYNFSSFNEYINNNFSKKIFCNKNIILDQFKNKDEYKKYCIDTLPIILKKKESEKELKEFLID